MPFTVFFFSLSHSCPFKSGGTAGYRLINTGALNQHELDAERGMRLLRQIAFLVMNCPLANQIGRAKGLALVECLF